MKMIFSRFSKFFLLLTVIFSAFMGCKIVPNDDSTAQRPDIDNTSSTSIKITLQSISTDTKYISVYRQKDGDKNSVLIGQIFPEAFDSNNYSFLFEDTLVTKGNKYKYMARYFDENETYYSTKWTDYYTANFGESETSYKYSIGSKVFIKFSTDDYTLKFKTSDDSTIDIKNPEKIADFATNYKPALAIKAVHEDYNLVQVFVFDKNGAEILSGTQTISLRGILPEGFYDCPLEIIGLLGQYTECNSDKLPMRIYWTQPTSIKVEGSVTVPNSGASSGLDYSFPEDETGTKK